MWGYTGRHVLVEWAEWYAASDPACLRAAFRCAAEGRARLAGESPDAVAGLCAEQVVLTSVAAAVLVARFADALEESRSAEAVAHCRQQSALGRRRLLAAARTLAKVRRARLPDVTALANVQSYLPPRGTERDPGSHAANE